MKPIPYGRQDITPEDIEAVVAALKSDYLTQGPRIDEFEKKFAQYVGCKYAVAVANGTAALHIGVLALGLKPGEKVITTSITFAASANCIRYCGGEVVFADIDPSSYLIDIASTRKLIGSAPAGTYKGIVVVDFAGLAANLEEWKTLADEFNLWIIEDASHSPGGYFTDTKGNKQICGNGKFADLAVFSFHPVKHIAAGEGGMITTNDEDLYNKVKLLRTHGITRDQADFTNGAPFATGVATADSYPGWYMEMQELGFNYRLTDFQSALGSSQLDKAEPRLVRRRAIAKKYDDAFRSFKQVRIQPDVRDRSGHAYHLYVIQAENRVGLYNHLRAKGVYSQVHYIPTHLMPYYRERGWKPGDLPNSEEYYKNCLSLPMFPTLTDEEQDHVINSIKSFYS